MGIGVDGLSNVYVCGSFMWWADFDPTENEDIRETEGTNGFISKFDINGNRLWTKIIITGPMDIPYDIASSVNGELYVTGVFISGFDINGFIRKYNSNGVQQWVRYIGSSGHDWTQGVINDNLGYVYVIGYFMETVDFDTGAGYKTYTSAGLRDIFVCKFSPSGFFEWARVFGGEGNEHGFGITVDIDDNIYGTGRFTGTVDFNPNMGNDYHTAVDNQDAYLLKLPPHGNW